MNFQSRPRSKQKGIREVRIEERSKNGNEVIITKYFRRGTLEQIDTLVKCLDIANMALDYSSYLVITPTSMTSTSTLAQRLQSIYNGPQKFSRLVYIRNDIVVAEIRSSNSVNVTFFKNLTHTESAAFAEHFESKINMLTVTNDHTTGLNEFLTLRKTCLTLEICPRTADLKLRSAFRYHCLFKLTLGNRVRKLSDLAKNKILSFIEKMPCLGNLQKGSFISHLSKKGFRFELMVRKKGRETESNFIQLLKYRFVHDVYVKDKIQRLSKKETMFFFHNLATLVEKGCVDEVKLKSTHFSVMKFMNLRSDIDIN